MIWNHHQLASKKLKFGIQNGLNVARAGYTEDQILTACHAC